ncbi:MAG TPA: hypothetical protein VGJ22_02005 [Anaerolineales bacterium]|jgi:tRNA nucleotidyltransferase (CCA-adding enzyme)
MSRPREDAVTDLSARLLDPKLLPPERLTLLRQVAAQAAASGASAYIVGGFVRDLLLGRRVSDFDIVIEGDAIRFADVLVNALGGTAARHAKFRTATWHLANSRVGDRDLKFIDLITARTESYSVPGALPTIEPATIDDDLRRRDFSINALAMRLDGEHFGSLLDPLKGLQDLGRGVVRVLHARSFLDDPTRMLRAVRYAARYGFALGDETRQLINPESRSTLSKLSGERVRREFDLIFEEEYAAEILARLGEFDLFTPLHPKLSAANHQLPTITEPPSEWGEFKTADILSLRQALGWALWLSSLDASEIESIAERLAFPLALKETATAGATLRSEAAALQSKKPSELTFQLDRLPAAAVYAVYLQTQLQPLKDYLVRWRHIKPRTAGDDLKARGLPPGPEYQRILSRLRAARLDGEITSDQQETKMLEELLAE